MTPANIIREAEADGVTVWLCPDGTIKASGRIVAVNRWLTEIRANKAAIIQALTIPQPLARMTGEQESAIRAWLALIEETDPATIAGVIDQCQRDADVRSYFSGRAVVELNQKGGE
ncbi:MAG: hypothetical protein ACK5QN_06650 [Burkholderiales bacterium]|jgi:hypothetical protein